MDKVEHNEVASLEQVVYVPSNQPYLHFYYWAASVESSCNYYDYAVVGLHPVGETTS
jgi:hypothetical protein